MIFFIPRRFRRALCAACCFACLGFAPRATAKLLRQSAPPAQDSSKQSRESGPPLRIPRQQAQTSAALDGVVRDSSEPGAARPVSAAVLTLRNIQSGQVFSGTTSGEGVFRVFPLPPGHYQLRVEANDFAPFVLPDLALQPNEVVTLEVTLVAAAALEARSRLPRVPPFLPKRGLPSAPTANYGIDSIPILPTSKIFHRTLFLRSPTHTTRFPIAGHSNSPITAAIPKRVSTFTQSLVGTILSTAIVSRATNLSGPRFSANKLF